jgi:hypothetical protein
MGLDQGVVSVAPAMAEQQGLQRRLVAPRRTQVETLAFGVLILQLALLIPSCCLATLVLASYYCWRWMNDDGRPCAATSRGGWFTGISRRPTWPP